VGMWWAPDGGEYLAFGRFEVADVREYELIEYSDDGSPYPTLDSYKYPVSGVTESVADVCVLCFFVHLSRRTHARTHTHTHIQTHTLSLLVCLFFCLSLSLIGFYM
jgi:hypothetical protein